MFTFTVEVSRANARILDSRPEFHKSVRDASLKFEVDDGAGYCWAEMPAQRIVAGKTINEQSEILADWAREALARLLTLKPGRYPSRRS